MQFQSKSFVGFLSENLQADCKMYMKNQKANNIQDTDEKDSRRFAL